MENKRNIISTSTMNVDQSRLVLHEFDDGTKVKFRVDENRIVHEISSSSKKATIISKIYKQELCQHRVDTKELDFREMDKWIIETLSGLWFRGGFDRYYFQLEEDAVTFKLTWGR